ncbi:MAG: 6-carboxytetrahydropterin synthase [Myxococcales bacterium]|nr:6-carboxytetrahydropterin synthase [Myxococcales bacterium]
MRAPIVTTTRYHRVVVAREQYKFSCAHMTVFPDGTKERLHGHNYQLGAVLELADVAFAQMIPFAAIKDALATICKEFRERVLLADANPFYEQVRADDDELEVRVCGRRYVFPREDVLLLPIDNVSAEALAAYLADRLVAALGPSLPPGVVHAVEVSVHESPGQGSSCQIRLG